MTRTRLCTPPKHDGAECVGSKVDTSDCSMQPCPVDGYWGEWTHWGGCHLNSGFLEKKWIFFGDDCGDGKRTRTRSCSEPEHGGRWCHPTVQTASQDCVEFNQYCDEAFEYGYMDQFMDG